MIRSSPNFNTTVPTCVWTEFMPEVRVEVKCHEIWALFCTQKYRYSSLAYRPIV